MVASQAQPKSRRGATARQRRGQLIGGLLAVLPDKGYAHVTIADIVAAASVSKRTFYEHFDDKEACFLAAYAVLSERTLDAVASVDATRPWDEQVRAAVAAYVAMLEISPAVARAFMLEVYAAGPEAVRMQRQTHARFAKLLRDLVKRARKGNPALEPLSKPMATAIVGGINELAIAALESESSLQRIAPTVVELVRRVLRGD